MLPVLKPKICSTRARRRDFARFDRFCFWLRAWPRTPFSQTWATMSLAVKISWHGAPDEFALQIRHDVILVAVVGLLVLLGPAGVQVFVGQAFRVGLPAGGHGTALDRGVLLAPVALPGHFDKRRVNDLAFPGDEALLGQPCIEGREEFAEEFRPRELLAELADRVLVGHRVGFGQSEKMLEAAAVEGLKLRLFIAQPIE